MVADISVPHGLTEKKIIDLISACDSLLKDNGIDQILKQIVTGGSKRVVLNKVKHRKS